MITRRTFTTCLNTLAFALFFPIAARSTTTSVRMTRDPNCGCCIGWADHLRENGFEVTVIDNPQVNRLKATLGVPANLNSCHTAEVDGYIIEGHVPSGTLRRLLRERPAAVRGLAVRGMPIGSPGMEMEDMDPEKYDVVAFGPTGQSVFARYEGGKEISENSPPKR